MSAICVFFRLVIRRTGASAVDGAQGAELRDDEETVGGEKGVGHAKETAIPLRSLRGVPMTGLNGRVIHVRELCGA